jgi:hypothetical protein
MESASQSRRRRKPAATAKAVTTDPEDRPARTPQAAWLMTPKTAADPPGTKRGRIICPKIIKMQQEIDFYASGNCKSKSTPAI